jgi:Fic family protein
MNRVTGDYRLGNRGGETVRAFIPYPLPPQNPPLEMDAELTERLSAATGSLGRLAVAGQLIPSADWFLYGFVRKEAVISSQIEGTQATLQDVLAFEATQKSQRLADVEEVCNYVDALTYARREIARPKGLPLSTRLLCETHKRLMRGQRGSDKLPGEIRRSPNWISGSRPGNALFVPPPPEDVPQAMSALERYLHNSNDLPPLVRAGLAHAQFETIHPFLDGNGRIGRLLIALLVEHWGLLPSPLLYLSLAFKRQREEYYRRLSAVRQKGDWEGWTSFFLKSVQEAADDGVATAQRTFALVSKDRQSLLKQKGATVIAVRLFDLLPNHPMMTLKSAIDLLDTTKPTAGKAIDVLCKAKILRETTGKVRDRVYAYHGYLQILTKDTQ